MAKTVRWTDGRSGDSGGYSGNLVLDDLDPTGRRILHHKGTVFVDSGHCWIGRVVGDDSYLTPGVLHWANVSADQHRELMLFAGETQRALLYLFITANQDSNLIRFWQVPAAILETELKRRKKYRTGSVLGLHISDREGRHMLGEADVSKYSAEFEIDAVASKALAVAVRNDRMKKRQSVCAEVKEEAATSGTSDGPSPAVRRFDIPLSEGRVATFSAPVPMTAQDVARVKGYIDLMSDLLVN